MINLCVSLFCRAHIPSTSTTTFYSLVLMICVYVGVLPCAQLKSMFSPQLMMMMTMMVRVSYGDTHNRVFNGFSLAFLCIFVTDESKQQQQCYYDTTRIIANIIQTNNCERGSPMYGTCNEMFSICIYMLGYINGERETDSLLYKKFVAKLFILDFVVIYSVL